MKAKFLAALTCLVLGTPTIAAESNSTYSQVPSDRAVGPAETEVLTQTISLAEPSWVYVQSDGRYIPTGGGAIATMRIVVDGTPVGNLGLTDWSVSKSPQQHSYNVIGAVFLGAGVHTVGLHALSLNNRSFTLGAASNLSAMIKPAASVGTASRGADSGVITHNVNGLTNTSVLPTVSHVNLPVDGGAGSTLVALATARIYRFGNAGDPLTAVALDGSTLPNNQASWSDNDMYEYAENQAPFFSQALVPNLGGAHTASLVSTALPYLAPQQNHVQYRVGGDSTLVTLVGGMSVVGAAPSPSDANNTTNYICVATNQGWPGCPPVGSDVIIAEGDIVVPAGHNGVVLIAGKTRIQAGADDAGGQGLLYLTVDGIQRGSLGAQQLASPSAVSTRTLGTSYLATGAEALTPGTHHVVLHATTTGSFKHLAMTLDLPLIWFD